MEASERLIVAADYDPRKEGGVRGVHKKVLQLGGQLEGLGVIIKVNSILRAVGFNLISDLQYAGLRVMADLKLIDIPHTLGMDGAMLAEYKPDMVTVMCCAGIEGMRQFRRAIGDNSEVLGVTVLTSFSEQECHDIFTCSTTEGILRFAQMGQRAELPGFVFSAGALEVLASKTELVLAANTPAIRPVWSMVSGDDQRYTMSPAKAIQTGVKRIIVGRPITQAANPRDAVMRTLEEIQEALDALPKKGE